LIILLLQRLAIIIEIEKKDFAIANHDKKKWNRPPFPRLSQLGGTQNNWSNELYFFQLKDPLQTVVVSETAATTRGGQRN